MFGGDLIVRCISFLRERKPNYRPFHLSLVRHHRPRRHNQCTYTFPPLLFFHSLFHTRALAHQPPHQLEISASIVTHYNNLDYYNDWLCSRTSFNLFTSGYTVTIIVGPSLRISRRYSIECGRALSLVGSDVGVLVGGGSERDGCIRWG